VNRTIRTGIDWSGDVGDPSRSGSTRWAIFAAVHCEDKNVENLESRLASLRMSRRLHPHYTFKYNHSRPVIRSAFFEALAEADLIVSVLAIDKLGWATGWENATPGNTRIAVSISTLLLRSQPELISAQRIAVDLPSEEGKLLRGIRDQVRIDFRHAGRVPPRSIKPVPDHATGAVLIQIADMTAGCLHDELLGMPTAWSSGFRRKVSIVD